MYGWFVRDGWLEMGGRKKRKRERERFVRLQIWLTNTIVDKP